MTFSDAGYIGALMVKTLYYQGLMMDWCLLQVIRVPLVTLSGLVCKAENDL